MDGMVFGKNNIILGSNMLFYLKRKMFNQCVFPALTYGVEAWKLTKQIIQRLQSTQ